MVSSVGMEIIQQAPFLPLTKSLVETISALNGMQLVATQESIAEYLAKTYQYVHMPKMNVIHDCLGILVKERRIYHTGNGYFVYTQSPLEKTADSAKEKQENGNINDAKDSICKDSNSATCEATSKKKTTKTDKAAKKKVKGKDNSKGNRPGKETEKADRNDSVDSERLKRVVDQIEEKSAILEPPSRENKANKTPSETASESGASETSTKKVKKQKKGVLEQLSCFIKGKSFPNSDIEELKEEQTPKEPSPPPQSTPTQKPAPLAVQEGVSPSLLRGVRFRHQRTLSAPAGSPSLQLRTFKQELQNCNESQIKHGVPNPRQLARSKSFVAAEKRPIPPAPFLRSNSFSAPSTKAARQLPTEGGPYATLNRRTSMNYGDIIRNSPARQTIHVSRPISSMRNMEIARPIPDMPQQQTLTRNNSMKNEVTQRKGSSLSPPNTPRNHLTPSSTPRLKEKSQGRVHPPLIRSKSFTEPRTFRPVNRSISHRATITGPYFESPLQLLLARRTNGCISPPSPSVRVTIPPKGKHFTPGKHPAMPIKRTPPSCPLRKQPESSLGPPFQKQNMNISPVKKDCTSPVCYDTSKINNRVENCKCNGVNSVIQKQFTAVSNPKHSYKPEDVSSEHICIEEMTSSGSETEDSYREIGVESESKSLGVYKKITEDGVNDSLTFIGII